MNRTAKITLAGRLAVYPALLTVTALSLRGHNLSPAQWTVWGLGIAACAAETVWATHRMNRAARRT